MNEIVKISDVVFPILCIKAGDAIVYAFKDKKEFCIAEKGLVENGIFNNTILFSSDGNKYKIIRVVNKGWATILWGYNPFLKGRQIKIDFDLEFIEKVSLLLLKRELNKYVNRNSSPLTD